MKKVFNVTLAVEVETDKDIKHLSDITANLRIESNEVKVRNCQIVDEFEVETTSKVVRYEA